MLRPPAHARSLCLARTCLRWEECVVWEEGGWGPGGKRCGAFQKDRFLWEISPEIKVLSAEIRVRKYTYNRREILVWANIQRHGRVKAASAAACLLSHGRGLLEDDPRVVLGLGAAAVFVEAQHLVPQKSV